MFVYWKIRFLDRNDKEFKDRYVYLDTATVPPAKRAAIELALEARTCREERGILRFRNLFRDGTKELICELAERAGGNGSSVPLCEYLEDESGQELTRNEMARILTGNPNAISLPSGAKQYYIDYVLSKPEPVPFDGINLSNDDLRTLGYFSRDLKELLESAFRKDGPGTLTTSGPGITEPTVTTAVSDDEIRSHVGIFRRLYMINEPGCFTKAVDVFCRLLGNHPLAKWVAGVRGEYEDALQSKDFWPLPDAFQIDFNKKRAIDVFLYTRYAHQPDDRRQQQYQDCLGQVQGERGRLLFFFLETMSELGLILGNGGRVIVAWFEHYCKHHSKTPDVIASLLDEHPGIGSQEKTADRQARLLREKVEDLAIEIWKQNGRPDGGHGQFLPEAGKELRNALEEQPSPQGDA